MRIAILTGGPSSGKSAVLQKLQQRGLPVIPEAGAAVIDAIQNLVGSEAERVWRREHRSALQALVLMHQKLLSEVLPAAPEGLVAAERGLLDGLAFCLEDHAPVPWRLLAEVIESRLIYEAVFVLEVLPEPWYNGGWPRDRSISMGRWCDAVYRAFGYPIRQIVFDTVDRRCDMIMDHLGFDPDFQNPSS
jgi:predicted ATPase